MSSIFLIHPLHYSNAGAFLCRPYPVLEAQHYPLNNLHLPSQNNVAAPLPRLDAPTIGPSGTSIYKPV